MLLTSSQVGILLSSSIVVIFTTLLFFAGYILQQQTLHNLQAVIRPPIPVPKHTAVPNTIPIDPRSRFGRKSSNNDAQRSSLQAFLSHSSPATIDWSKLAYVQVVKSHAEVCSAVMLFASLHRLKSAPRRVLVFPQYWALSPEGEVADPYIETSRRLLKKAARRYRVQLQPMTTVVKGADEMSPESYSLTAAFGMTSYSRLLYLASPGIMLDPAPLDSLLAYAPSQSFAALPGSSAEAPSISDSLYLLKPSKEQYTNFTSTLASKSTSDFDLLSTTFPVPGSYFPDYLLPSSGSTPLVTTSSSLTLYSERDLSSTFNTTDFLSHTAWVRLWDPELPGPEYDVPYHERRRVAPQDENARIVWERMYGVFREERQEICGLDLETFKGEYGAKKGDKKAKEEELRIKVQVESDGQKKKEVELQIQAVLSGEGATGEDQTMMGPGTGPQMEVLLGEDGADGILM